MKIGILTQTLHNNYGGLLQNYALQQVLIRAGYEPCTIDHSQKEHICFLHQFTRKLKVYIGHYLFPKKYKMPSYVLTKREESIVSHNTTYFINKYINRTKVLKTHKEFIKLATIHKYHAYIVGSDQCWRPRYNKSFLKEMFLNFVEKQDDIRRIAYAASFGKDEWNLPSDIISECAQLALKFDLITVREDSGVMLCKKYLGMEAQHVLDPTMLLSKDDYIRIVEDENEPQSLGNLFYYILDPSEKKSQFLYKAASRLGLIPFTVMPKYPRGYRAKENIKSNIEECVYPPITSWLRAFMDAEMIIVDSYHGMVFSIIFNKPFWVIGNNDRGLSRFTSLLNLFGLSDRLIDINQLEDVDMRKSINWRRINEIRDAQSKYSLSLLYDALKSTN